MNLKAILFSILIVLLLNNCQKKKLPVLGQYTIETREENGRKINDTIYHTIPDFAFIDQDSNMVTQNTFKGKIYVADFIFTTCPSICPIMKTQMKRVYDEFKDNPDVLFLSHSIDPQHDSVAVLKAYADRIGGVESSKWHFVTGEQKKIFDIGQKSYMVTATSDEKEPSGVLHSGAFVLIDKNRRVRGIYDGTVKKEVNKLMDDIQILLKES